MGPCNLNLAKRRQAEVMHIHCWSRKISQVILHSLFHLLNGYQCKGWAWQPLCLWMSLNEALYPGTIIWTLCEQEKKFLLYLATTILGMYLFPRLFIYFFLTIMERNWERKKFSKYILFPYAFTDLLFSLFPSLILIYPSRPRSGVSSSEKSLRLYQAEFNVEFMWWTLIFYEHAISK